MDVIQPYTTGGEAVGKITVCKMNGHHVVYGEYDACPVCAIAKSSKYREFVKLYGHYTSQYSRLLAVCRYGHKFYTSGYMSSNITKCCGLSTVRVDRSTNSNHVYSEEIGGVVSWLHQDSIKIKRMLALILNYMSSDSITMGTLKLSCDTVRWQDDMCPVGNVIACNHSLHYVVTYVYDPQYVDASAWCRFNNYMLVEIDHDVGRKHKVNKNVNVKTITVLSKAFLDAKLLVSYRPNLEAFLEMFITSRHVEFTQLGSIIVR
jgi:hypothetical protein